MGEQQRELFATPTRQDIVASQPDQHALGGLSQHVIAGGKQLSIVGQGTAVMNPSVDTEALYSA